MSRYVESRYEVERRRRQELFEQRVRETTRTYLERYERVVSDGKHHGRRCVERSIAEIGQSDG